MLGNSRYLAVVAAGSVALFSSLPGAVQAGTYRPRFVDDAHRLVTLRAPAHRIVSLAPSNTEILLAMGLKKDLVGVDAGSFAYLPSPYRSQIRGITNVGSAYSGPNLETIVSLHPDLLLAISWAPYLTRLQRMGYPIAILSPSSFAGIYHDIWDIGAATGHPVLAATLVHRMRTQVQAIVRAVSRTKSRPTVYLELDPTYYTVGPGSFLDSLITMAGGRNVVDVYHLANSAYPQLNPEQILAANPQVIILDDTPGVTPQQVAARPGWNRIRAVRQGRVYANINPDYLSQPAPAIVTGLRLLAQDLHPHLSLPPSP